MTKLARAVIADHLALASARFRKTLLLDLDVEAPDVTGSVSAVGHIHPSSIFAFKAISAANGEE